MHPFFDHYPDIQSLKTRINFRNLILETHKISKTQKILCPVHNDTHPSCHIYADHFYCFSCGAYGDAIDWIKIIYECSTLKAVEKLQQRLGQNHFYGYIQHKHIKAPSTISIKPVADYHINIHLHDAQCLERLPLAAQKRGFTFEDAKKLLWARDKEDLIFPILDPEQRIVAIKRRRASNKIRYIHEIKGHGNPAWCSPNLNVATRIILMEGELNAMIAWCTVPQLAFMGIAGANARPYSSALKGRQVYIYADKDSAGNKAKEHWATSALDAQASYVALMPAWQNDACAIADQEGRKKLANKLHRAIQLAQSYDAPKTICEDISSLNEATSPSQNNGLMKSYTQSSKWCQNNSPWEQLCQ